MLWTFSPQAKAVPAVEANSSVPHGNASGTTRTMKTFPIDSNPWSLSVRLLPLFSSTSFGSSQALCGLVHLHSIMSWKRDTYVFVFSISHLIDLFFILPPFIVLHCSDKQWWQGPSLSQKYVNYCEPFISAVNAGNYLKLCGSSVHGICCWVDVSHWHFYLDVLSSVKKRI